MSCRRAALLTLLCTAACGGGATLDAGFESELGDTQSCQGFFLATSDDDTVMLVFRPGSTPAEVAATTSGSEVYDFDAGTVAVLYVETGTDLGAGFCSDATPMGHTESRYHALTGTADFRAVAADAGGWDVTLSVRDMLLGKELDDHRVFVAELDLAGSMP